MSPFSFLKHNKYHLFLPWRELFLRYNNNTVKLITEQCKLELKTITMTRVNSLADLEKLRKDLQGQIKIRETRDHSDARVQVRVAMATCGIASGARDVMNFFTDALEKRRIASVVTQTGCMGYCYAEPTIEVTLPGSEPLVFGEVDVAKADEIIEKYIRRQELVDGIIPVSYKTIENKEE
jgi:NADP-reducing hydrogenase subunit HndB